MVALHRTRPLCALLLLGAAVSAQSARFDDYLKAPDIDANDSFGLTLLIDGDTLVVNSPGDDSAAAGVGGDFLNDTLPDAGGVFIYARDGKGWALQEYLKPNDPTLSKQWGGSLALDGNTLVVGSRLTDVPFNDAGAAYVFIRVGNTWLQQGVLRASNPGSFDNFGFDVAISGDTIVVGCPGEDGSDAGVNGESSDNSSNDTGAAFVFTRTAGVWTEQAYLKASNPDNGDSFGTAVAIDGDTIVVSTPLEDSLADSIDGDQFDDGSPGVNVGAAYVFTRDAGSWSQQSYLKPDELLILNQFGTDIALDGERLLVGAAFHGQNLETPIGAIFGRGGAGYVFERTGTTWTETALLRPASATDGDQYGTTVALDGDRLLLGGDQGDTPIGENTGAVALFEREGGSWVQRALASAPNGDSNDRFVATGLSGDSVVVGAKWEDSEDASGGDSAAGNNSGAVYTFTITSWSDEGCALSGTAGAPELIGDGTLAGGSFNAVALRNAAPSAFSGLFIGTTDTPTPFKGGTLKPVPWLKLTFLNTSTSGAVELPFVMPNALPSGTELWVQMAITDAGAPVGVALSNALRGVVP